VISLKKYLDLDPEELKKFLPKSNDVEPEDLLSLTVGSYRSALLAMGDCGAVVCPTLGADLQDGLSSPAGRLAQKITADRLRKTEEQVIEQLQQWGGRAAEHFKQKANEVRELLIVLAGTAASVAERDQRHANQFTELTANLHSIADLEDLAQIRTSLVEKAAELKICVDRMEQDSRESVAQLQAQVVAYQTKLQEAEQQASRDPLTGLDNRRSVQKKIEHRIVEKQPFSVAMLDLNDFKQVNDQFGHLAGDELLKQFATELRSAFQAGDVVGRWGGDEFVLVMDCNLDEATARVERVQKWVCGEYTVQSDTEACKVPMRASVGLAQWEQGSTMQKVLERADGAMYRQKTATRLQPHLETFG
jgi:diguanylate cyclase